jgi:signal peptidase II
MTTARGGHSAAAAWLRALAVAVAAIGLDQLSKAAIVSAYEVGETQNVFFGIDLTFVKNQGIAFGALSDGGPLILILVAVAMVLLLAYFATHARVRLLWLPVGAILGGAVGNVIDRVRLGYVVDFIDPIAWPAFNLADAFIVLGVIGFVILLGSGREPAGAA